MKLTHKVFSLILLPRLTATHIMLDTDIVMKRASITLLLVFALLIAFASVAVAQMAEKGRKKTVTLPNGEIILDISGEGIC